MKQHIVPTNREIRLEPTEFIVTKSDLSGRITYANRTFMSIANYPESFLLGKQHNLVRHPDMPRGVFRMLWETLGSEQEFFGYIKNITSDGSYYWVFANVTPDRDYSGKMVGYFSVRRKPKQDAIPKIESLYREMIEIEKRTGPADAPAASARYLTQKIRETGTSYDRFVLSV